MGQGVVVRASLTLRAGLRVRSLKTLEEGWMRLRAGTEPITLEPSRIQEILSLSRHHDDLLKEARQDLLRAETQLRVERAWKWPIRAACFGLGALGLAGLQDQILMARINDFVGAVGKIDFMAGNSTLIGLMVGGVAIYAMILLVQRLFGKPSPEEAARKLMEQFAQRDGVAAYVFSGEEIEDAEELAASTTMLTRKQNKTFRQRRLTPATRTLQSSLTTLLNRTLENAPREPYLH
jgi:hypothetical protein